MGGTTSSTSGIVKFDVLRDRDNREYPEDPAASDPTTTDLNTLTTPLSFENEHYIGISHGHDGSREGNRKKTKSCKEKPACRLTTEADNRIYVIVAALFLLLDVLLLTLFIVVLVLPENVQTTDDPEASTSSLSRKVALEDSAFCLPCSEVYLNKLEVEQNRFKVNVHNATASDSDDLGICCEEPLSDLKYFVQTMYIRVRYQTNRAQGLFKYSNQTDEVQQPRPSPNLKLSAVIKGPWQEVNGTYLVPLSQEADEHASYDQQNGTIVVKERGMYYIFSQVPFRYNDGTSNKTQFLYRIRNDGEELLLENSVYPCGANPRGCMQSFVGGTFLLDSGDRLCLRVSDHQCLDDRRKVEFGVQRI